MKFRQSMENVWNSSKAPMWLPYLQSIEHVKDDIFKFTYNGGCEETSLKNISAIMLYGDFGPLDTRVLEQVCLKGVPIVIHKRNVDVPIYITRGIRKEQISTLEQQILKRANLKASTHICRKLLAAKFYSMRWLIPTPKKISKRYSIKELRLLEAKISRRYWRAFFTKLKLPHLRRRSQSNIKAALDAMSRFISGIVLRWTTYHHLSPFHGFLHQQTDYPALVYDLMEPYRGEFEKFAFQVIASTKNPEKNSTLVGAVINETKQALNEHVYTGLTRQIVTRHELLHGIVLALKSYLLGKTKKFMVPTIDKPNGGRPRKVPFRLYGRQAGKTDFWQVAHKVSAGKT